MLAGGPLLRTEAGHRRLVVGEVVEMLDSNKILAQSAPPGVDDRIALAFPRSAQVGRLAGEPSRYT